MNKKFQYGLKLWSVNTGSYKNEAQRLYDEGLYDFIELYSVPGSLETLTSWKMQDIPFVIHAPHYKYGLNLSNPELFDSNMDLVKLAQTFADGLNAEYIVFHPGSGGKITETIRQVNLINDSRILVENKPYKTVPKMKADFCTGSRPEEIKMLLENTNAGFCFDIGHAIAAASSFNLDYIEYTREFITLNPTLYHISDTDIQAEVDFHYNFGNGNMDTAGILELLPENSKITIETNKKSKHNLDDFRDDINYLNNLLTTARVSCQNK